MSLAFLVSQVMGDVVMVRDVHAGILGDPYDMLTWLVKIPKEKNDEYRLAAWYILNSAGEWVNKNLKKIPVPAIRFKMEHLGKPTYEIEPNPEKYASLPMPVAEAQMI